MTPLPTITTTTTTSLVNRKRVHFNASVQVREVARFSQVNADKDELWHSRCDLSSFRSRDRQLIDMMEQNLPMNDIQGHCTRGLESKTSDIKYRRRRTRKEARNAVLAKQAYQTHCGFVDSAAIALIYGDLARQSQRDACVAGMKDERYVRVFVEEKVVSTVVCSQRTTSKTVSTVAEKMPSNDSSTTAEFRLRRVAGVAA